MNVEREAFGRAAHGRIHLALALGVLAALSALMGPLSAAASAAPLVGVDLSSYVRVGRFDLPEPTRTTAPVNSKLAQEASGVAYRPDTDSLFIVGDGSTSVVQVDTAGNLIDSMTLALGGSPQGTEFYDTEGIAYVGGGRFVLVEERDRQAVLFTYAAGTTLTRADTQTVKLGTTVGNIGLEGITSDPQTGGFIVAKESGPKGIFQTGIDFAAGTATNGSPTTVNSTDLFDPALTGVLDHTDVFALSNLTTLSGPQTGNLLVLSQESGRIISTDRSGNISSTLTIASDPGNPRTVPDQGHEGLTMDDDGNLYVVSEEGGGDIDHPQLWVYSPSAVPNQAPTAVTLTNQVNAVVENTSTVTRLKVADVAITDDGLGTNGLTLSGPDAAAFQVDSTGLYIKAGTVLDYETKTSYGVTVDVDDATVGASPDASAASPSRSPMSSTRRPTCRRSSSPRCRPGAAATAPTAPTGSRSRTPRRPRVDITGFKVDDSSNAFASGRYADGVAQLAADG